MRDKVTSRSTVVAVALTVAAVAAASWAFWNFEDGELLAGVFWAAVTAFCLTCVRYEA
jgi:hypothetical protein